MRIAFYTGDHAADGLMARAGWALTRLAQKGRYGHITHCEAIHALHADGTVTIASASLRDNGVRSKRIRLNPAHWIIANVPSWDVQESIDMLARTNGMRYDLRGALATVLPGKERHDRWFCSEWVAAPYLGASETFGPHHLCALALSIGENMTLQFFASRA